MNGGSRSQKWGPRHMGLKTTSCPLTRTSALLRSHTSSPLAVEVLLNLFTTAGGSQSHKAVTGRTGSVPHPTPARPLPHPLASTTNAIQRCHAGAMPARGAPVLEGRGHQGPERQVQEADPGYRTAVSLLGNKEQHSTSLSEKLEVLE